MLTHFLVTVLAVQLGTLQHARNLCCTGKSSGNNLNLLHVLASFAMSDRGGLWALLGLLLGALHLACAQIVVRDAAVVVTEQELLAALRDTAISTIFISIDLKLTPALWPARVVVLGRNVTIQARNSLFNTFRIDQSGVPRGAVVCYVTGCHLRIEGPGLVFTNNAVEVPDFANFMPVLFSVVSLRG